MKYVSVVSMKARSVSPLLTVQNTAHLRNQGFLVLGVEAVKETRKLILSRYRMRACVCVLEVLVEPRGRIVWMEENVRTKTSYANC